MKQRISFQVLALSLPDDKIGQGVSGPVKYNNNSFHFLGLSWRLKELINVQQLGEYLEGITYNIKISHY